MGEGEQRSVHLLPGAGCGAVRQRGAGRDGGATAGPAAGQDDAQREEGKEPQDVHDGDGEEPSAADDLLLRQAEKRERESVTHQIFSIIRMFAAAAGIN